MGIDPRWLEILKASGWQSGALSAASALLLYLNAKKQLPTPLDSWVIQIAEVCLLVFGFLSLFSIGPYVVRALNGFWRVLARRFALRRVQHRVAADIPSMTTKEREIIGYLLANNQKMFTYTIDGGEANTLLSKGIVVCALLPGQSATAYGVPFKVPDLVWDVLVKHKAEFPNTWKEGESFPYAISWMSR